MSKGFKWFLSQLQETLLPSRSAFRKQTPKLIELAQRIQCSILQTFDCDWIVLLALLEKIRNYLNSMNCHAKVKYDYSLILHPYSIQYSTFQIKLFLIPLSKHILMSIFRRPLKQMNIEELVLVFPYAVTLFEINAEYSWVLVQFIFDFSPDVFLKIGI